MTNWHTTSTDDLCRALLSLKTVDECYAFLEDVCTIKEIQDLSQRLQVAAFLARGESYTTITRETGASTATISRVNKCFEYGTGGYRAVIAALEADKGEAQNLKADACEPKRPEAEKLDSAQ